MASCYTIRAQKGNFELSFNADRELTSRELSDPNVFFKYLAQYLSDESHLELKNAFKDFLFLNDKEIKRLTGIDYPSIRFSQSNEINTIIANNLRSLGLKVAIVEKYESDDDMPEDIKKLPKELLAKFLSGRLKAAVYNGEIYINGLNRRTDITAPAHELLHMVLAVMKLTDFKAYRNLLDTVSLFKSFKDEEDKFNRLQAFNLDYKGMSRLDLKEEIFARYMESLMKKKSAWSEKINPESDTIYDMLLDLLAPAILEVFALQSKPSVLEFLNSTIKDIPTFGTRLFYPQRMETTGFLAKSLFSTENAKIVQLIKYWSTTPIPGELGKRNPQTILTEMECK